MKSHPNKKAHAPRRIKAQPVRAALPPELLAKQLMQRFELAFMARDVEAVMACLGPGFEWRLPDGQCFIGRRQVRNALEQRFSASGGPRFSKSVFRYFGSTVVQTYRVQVPDANGKLQELRGMDVYKLRGGVLLRKDAYWKAKPLRAQPLKAKAGK